jgi:monoamine oxidase
MSNDNRGALLQSDQAFDGKPVRNRQMVDDIRGYVAELAAKSIDASALDQAVSNDDKEHIRVLLRSFGALDKDMHYKGSGRAGYSEVPGGGTQVGTAKQPLDLRAILAAGFWRYQTNFGESWDQAATMMQPVGGMGRIGEAFGAQLRGSIVYNAQLRALRRTANGASVVWHDGKREHATETSIVVVTVPPPVLRDMPNDFAPDTRSALAAVDYVPAVKVAFQAERRFWELDESIYGGISWTSHEITQVWYPSAGIHQRKGILVGAYIWSDDVGDKFTGMPPAARIEAALRDGEVLHPNYRKHLTKGVTVAWKNIPFSGGAWSEWSKDARTQYYGTLLKGDGPFLFAGEHMSYLNGWQEGALRSAHYALRDIVTRLQA